MDWILVLNSLLLGVGMSIDAFFVSISDSLNEPDMKKGKMLLISASFGIFQAVMPLAGYFCIRYVREIFEGIEVFVPWISLILLGALGIKEIISSVKNREESEKTVKIGIVTVLIQSVATSLDALSLGFSIYNYTVPGAIVSSVIIGIVTFAICCAGMFFSSKIGSRFRGGAGIAGGVILILVGIEIFVSNIVK